jgi:uncharacterized protein YjbJ (UPF0337 family)
MLRDKADGARLTPQEGPVDEAVGDVKEALADAEAEVS